MYFKERSLIIFKFKRTSRIINFLYKLKVRKGIPLRTVYLILFQKVKGNHKQTIKFLIFYYR